MGLFEQAEDLGMVADLEGRTLLEEKRNFQCSLAVLFSDFVSILRMFPLNWILCKPTGWRADSTPSDHAIFRHAENNHSSLDLQNTFHFLEF